MTISEKVREIPEPLSVHVVRMEDGAVITLRRHGNPAGPRLVMSHAYGLASCFSFFDQTSVAP